MRTEFLRVLAVAATLHGTVMSQDAVAQATPDFNNEIPEWILTHGCKDALDWPGSGAGTGDRRRGARLLEGSR